MEANKSASKVNISYSEYEVFHKEKYESRKGQFSKSFKKNFDEKRMVFWPKTLISSKPFILTINMSYLF